MQRIDFILDTPSQAKIAAAFIAGLVEQGITFTATRSAVASASPSLEATEP